MIPYVVGAVVGGATLYGFVKYLKGGRCTLTNRIDDKVVLITGANTGIGLETAIELAKRGAYVHIGCRNEERCRAAREIILDKSAVSQDRVVCHSLDLASIRSILDFAEKFRSQCSKLDILINNAGVMMCPYLVTEDGFEMQMGVNHLGHFLLTNELLGLVKAGGGGRIINVSSLAHERGSFKDMELNIEKATYNSIRAYGCSKLFNVLHANYLAKILQKDNVTVVSLHPGAVATELTRHFSAFAQWMLGSISWMLMKSPAEGAQTSIQCALDPDLARHSGLYFSDCIVKKSSNPEAHNDQLAEELWKRSLEMLQPKVDQIRQASKKNEL